MPPLGSGPAQSQPGLRPAGTVPDGAANQDAISQQSAPEACAPSASQARSIEAQLALGQMLFEAGEAAQAWDAFAAAARRGDGRAMNMLGRLAQYGWEGRAADPALAARQYSKAAEHGSAWALFNLADLYLNGRGVAADGAQAVALYQRAAKAGVSKALNMLGLCYEEGHGVARDMAQALRFYQAGADADDCWACFNLGRLALAQGERAEALAWFTRASDCGFAGFWRALSEALRERPEPAFLALAEAALARAQAGEAALGARQNGARHAR